MLWSNSIIPPPMEYCLRLLSAWPEHNNVFFFLLYLLLGAISLCFQLYNSTIVYQDLDLLTDNVAKIILVTVFYLNTVCIWKQRRYVKNILTEMMDDWNNIKNPVEANIMNKYVHFSHQVLITTFIAYNATTFWMLGPAIKSYFSESFENRLLPMQATFPFSNKISPNYEIILFVQSILVLLTITGYSLTDSIFVAIALHAITKLEILRLTVDNVLKEDCKPTDRFSIKIIMQKHLNVLQFSRKFEKIFSGPLLIHFSFNIVQFAFLGFTCVMSLSDNIGMNTFLKYALWILNLFVEMAFYCFVGEFLQTKSDAIAEAAYFLPWYNLKCCDSKSVMMFIQGAQKPITITAGKVLVVSHFTLISVLKASVSYLSVLRAMRV